MNAVHFVPLCAILGYEECCGAVTVVLTTCFAVFHSATPNKTSPIDLIIPVSASFYPPVDTCTCRCFRLVTIKSFPCPCSTRSGDTSGGGSGSGGNGGSGGSHLDVASINQCTGWY